MADQMVFIPGLDSDSELGPGERQGSTGRSGGRRGGFSGAQTRAQTGSHTRASSSRNEAESARARTVMIRSILAASLISLAIAGLGLLFERVIAPGIRIQNISIESDVASGNDTILSMAKVSRGMSYFAANVDDIRKRLEAWPMAKSVSVTKIFPSTLRIQVTARKPLGLAFAKIDGIETPVAFDADGVVFETAASIRGWDLPVLSGVEFQNFATGVRFPPRIVDFIRQLEALKLSSPALFSLISEYRIVPRSDGDFDVLLYPVHQHVAVRIGSHIDRDLCMYILRSLDVLQKQGTLGNLQEIDFRTDDVVYTTK